MLHRRLTRIVDPGVQGQAIEEQSHCAVPFLEAELLQDLRSKTYFIQFRLNAAYEEFASPQAAPQALLKQLGLGTRKADLLAAMIGDPLAGSLP
jgi:hypothetical protein